MTDFWMASWLALVFVLLYTTLQVIVSKIRDVREPLLPEVRLPFYDSILAICRWNPKYLQHLRSVPNR